MSFGKTILEIPSHLSGSQFQVCKIVVVVMIGMGNIAVLEGDFLN